MPSSDDNHPHGPLRRKDREILDRAEIDAIIQAGTVLYLSLAEDNIPFVVPVYYAYDGEALYFHSAKVGTKIRMLKRNNQVCFAISLDHGVIEDAVPCDFEARHRTVIGVGTATFIEEAAAKAAALDRIVARFTDRKFTYPATTLNNTAVIRIAIATIKGKKYGR
jgi:uncharacterized protein